MDEEGAKQREMSVDGTDQYHVMVYWRTKDGKKMRAIETHKEKLTQSGTRKRYSMHGIALNN